ncbi:MAG: hypothetical protein AB1512_01005 [Thermodesulfobacteriota bacterium]
MNVQKKQPATRNPQRATLKRLPFAFLIFSLFCALSFASTSKFKPFIERFPEGKVDWDAGYFYGTGVGYPHLNDGSKAKALKVAEAKALSAILQVASGLRVDDQRTLADLQREKAVIQIRALIRYEPHERQFVQEGKLPFYRVTYRAPMKGVQGLTRNLLPHVRSGRPAGEDTIRTEPPVDEDEGATWLVLDGRGLSRSSPVQPALFPKIVTEKGEAVFDLNVAEEGALVQKGMARYVVSDKSREEILSRVELGGPVNLAALLGPSWALAQEKGERKRQGKVIVKDVSQVQGLMKTNLVISEADAREIKDEDASSQILKKCRVIVVVSSSLGGIEGGVPWRLARSD